MTPSTLTMGTILKTKLLSKTLAYSVPDTKKSITPSIINPEVVSPGCCLAIIQTDFLDLFKN